MVNDPVKIQDIVKVALVEKSDKPPRNLENITELNRRRKQIPQKWYPLVVKDDDWPRFLKKGSWLKVVYDNADVVIGQLSSKAKKLGFYTESVLINGDLGNKDSMIGIESQMIQAFTNDERIAKATKENNA